MIKKFIISKLLALDAWTERNVVKINIKWFIRLLIISMFGSLFFGLIICAIGYMWIGIIVADITYATVAYIALKRYEIDEKLKKQL